MDKERKIYVLEMMKSIFNEDEYKLVRNGSKRYIKASNTVVEYSSLDEDNNDIIHRKCSLMKLREFAPGYRRKYPISTDVCYVMNVVDNIKINIPTVFYMDISWEQYNAIIFSFEQTTHLRHILRDYKEIVKDISFRNESEKDKIKIISTLLNQLKHST